MGMARCTSPFSLLLSVRPSVRPSVPPSLPLNLRSFFRPSLRSSVPPSLHFRNSSLPQPPAGASARGALGPAGSVGDLTRMAAAKEAAAGLVVRRRRERAVCGRTWTPGPVLSGQPSRFGGPARPVQFRFRSRPGARPSADGPCPCRAHRAAVRSAQPLSMHAPPAVPSRAGMGGARPAARGDGARRPAATVCTGPAE